VELVAEIALLDDRLLRPVATAFPQPLSNDEKISVNAFLVLGHACVEEHIEESFMSHAARLSEEMAGSAPSGQAARIALAFGLNASERIRKANPYEKRDLKAFAQQALRQYEASVVQQNHGVKAGNVRKLAEGVGLAWAEFDRRLGTALADLDNLGSRRGEAGHMAPLTTKATKVTNRVDPDDVRRWVLAGRDAAVVIRGELDRLVQHDIDRAARRVVGPRAHRP
jgi:DNA-binding transcriptional regulator YiaG